MEFKGYYGCWVIPICEFNARFYFDDYGVINKLKNLKHSRNQDKDVSLSYSQLILYTNKWVFTSITVCLKYNDNKYKIL